MKHLHYIIKILGKNKNRLKQKAVIKYLKQSKLEAKITFMMKQIKLRKSNLIKIQSIMVQTIKRFFLSLQKQQFQDLLIKAKRMPLNHNNLPFTNPLTEQPIIIQIYPTYLQHTTKPIHIQEKLCIQRALKIGI